jgi:tripartite-type tricarboxylate transporter receptor subunit TctC
MNIKTLRKISFVIAGAAAVLAGPAVAQDFPSKSSTIVVGYTPGGSNDMVARIVGQHLATMWGHPVLIENRPGAAGAIAATYVAKTKSDGYTLLLGPTTFLITSAVDKKLPFEIAKDFDPVAMLASSPLAFAVATQSPIKNMADFIVEAKKEKKFGATTGIADIVAFGYHLLTQQTGVKLEQVQYKGVEFFIDLFAGRVDAYFGSVASVSPHVHGGRARALAVTGAERSSVLKDVPTFNELGIKNVDLLQWWGLFAPAGTPKAVVERINRDVATVLAKREVREALEKVGATPAPMTPPQFKAYVESESRRFEEVAKNFNLVSK